MGQATAGIVTGTNRSSIMIVLRVIRIVAIALGFACLFALSRYFTAVTMVISTVFWTTSSIRFNAEMGLLLAIWMAVSYVGSQTLTPVLIVLFRPGFIMKEAHRAPASVRMSSASVVR